MQSVCWSSRKPSPLSDRIATLSRRLKWLPSSSTVTATRVRCSLDDLCPYSEALDNKVAMGSLDSLTCSRC